MQHITGREQDSIARAPEGVASAATVGMYMPQARTAPGVQVRTMEILASVAFAACGALGIWDSARLGASWGADGPQSGYFPLWIGVLLVTAAAANLFAVARAQATDGEDAPRSAPEMFLTWEQARTVASVFIPTAIYVAAVPFTGIYVASAVLVAYCMMRLGGFSPMRAVPAGIATAVVTFVVFEIWFLVALPKGPLEDMLGY